jgi:hypothetical protein
MNNENKDFIFAMIFIILAMVDFVALRGLLPWMVSAENDIAVYAGGFLGFLVILGNFIVFYLLFYRWNK